MFYAHNSYQRYNFPYTQIILAHVIKHNLYGRILHGSRPPLLPSSNNHSYLNSLNNYNTYYSPNHKTLCFIYPDYIKYSITQLRAIYSTYTMDYSLLQNISPNRYILSIINAITVIKHHLIVPAICIICICYIT